MQHLCFPEPCAGSNFDDHVQNGFLSNNKKKVYHEKIIYFCVAGPSGFSKCFLPASSGFQVPGGGA
jgi:hypothetical protein